MSIAFSQIISNYSAIKQNLDADDTMGRIKKLKTFMKKRRANQSINLSDNNKKEIEEDLQLEKFANWTDHKIKIQQLYQKFETSPTEGLRQDQAVERMRIEGRNCIPQKPQAHWALQFFKQMSDPFSLFMWVLMILNFILFGFVPTDLNSLMLAWILIVVLFSGAILSYSYNKQTESIVKSFQEFIPKYTTVIRDGQLKTITGDKLVRGDIVMISAGEKIPADIRIIESYGMKVNNATFTGEPDLIRMSSFCTNEQNPLDSKNVAFSGTINEEGQGKAIVLNTGMNTLISQIADQILLVEAKSSRIEYEVQHYVKRATLWAFFVGTLTFSIGMGNGFHPVIAAMIAIGVTIASVPGVLNLLIRVMFTISVKKMSQIKLIAKNIYTLQTLGAVTCICVDKTGTLTLNKMSVSKFYFNDSIYGACNSQEEYSNKIYRQYNMQDPTFLEIMRCAALCSTAKFDEAPPRQNLNMIHSQKQLKLQQIDRKEQQFKRQWKENLKKKSTNELPVIGDATEAALIRFFQPIADIEHLRKTYPVVKNKEGSLMLLPFTSARKYQISLHQIKSQNSYFTVYAKGAPQIIWNMCTQILINGVVRNKNQETTHHFNISMQGLVEGGQRALAFAYFQLSAKTYPQNAIFTQLDNNFKLLPMIFLGGVSLTDLPRLGVPDSILRMKVAGIKVVMLTGDQISTATKIARECNIIQSEKTANEIAKQENIEIQEAMTKANAIVVEGDEIFKLKVEQNEIVDEVEESSMLHKILEIDEVIFARTSPSQKLMIVDALQKMGHVVAVTGDGVNDSPAVSLADCGISMGSGSDATRDASSIVLVDDNFNNIVKGIQQGRRMYDNLRKCIVYVMTSQLCEFVPFLFLITFRIPIPIFTLLVDAGADFVPALAYAYEEPEIGIMTRLPRDKEQNLVSVKLLAHASGWNGFAGFFACFCCYWIMMKDYGFTLDYLWTKSNIPILVPDKSDSYNPTSPTFGNSNLAKITTCSQFNQSIESLDWINSTRPWADLRMSVVTCTQVNGVAQFTKNMVFDQCRVQQISIVSLRPICYTTEAAKYSQSAYMMGNVINQFFVAFMCKTRRQSVFKHGLRNKIIFLGFAGQYLLNIALLYTWLFQALIGTRDLLFFHLGLPAIPLGILQFSVDQLRKYLIRNVPRNNFGDSTRRYEDCKPNWFERNAYW